MGLCIVGIPLGAVYFNTHFSYVSNRAEEHESAYDLGALYSGYYKPKITLSSGDILDTIKTGRSTVIMNLHRDKRYLTLYIKLNSGDITTFGNVWLAKVVIKEKNGRVTIIELRDDPACETRKDMCKRYVDIADEAYEYYEDKILMPALKDQADHLEQL